jgi:hypothetical protein
MQDHRQLLAAVSRAASMTRNLSRFDLDSDDQELGGSDIVN